jgi:secretory carrier-associated membrane protein
MSVPDAILLIFNLLAYSFLVLPLIFHSIQDEIPEASRPLITRLYQLWLILLLTLVINMLACIFILTAGAADGARDVGASIGSASVFLSDHFPYETPSYLFIIPVTSFLLWYRYVDLPFPQITG